MLAAHPVNEIEQPTPVPRLLVELPSWSQVFFENLRDLISPRSLPPLDLHSIPAPFWSDVFVTRRLPWPRFLQSVACHVAALALLIAFTRFFALQPQVIAKPIFDHAQVIYYQPSEYLPALDTRSVQMTQAPKPDPEISRQPIISVPPEADNRSQTIVTAPNIKLKHDVALPNIVAWSDKMSDDINKPRLAIPPVPLTPAADISRIAPQLQNSVVAPPPNFRTSVAATFQTPQPAVIAPPPTVRTASDRPLGDLNIGLSSVIVPPPQLPLAEQRAIAGSSSAGLGAPQLVPPPPSLSASSSSFGARGRLIALSLHPAVGAPPSSPPGNRRGTFASTPGGRAGASGSPGANSGNTIGGAGSGGKQIASGSTRKGNSNAPAGLYVGSTDATTSPVAGGDNKVPSNSVNPNLVASLRQPRVTSAPSRPVQSENASKLSDAERAVFGNRKFYSLTLNMPNLNSAGGSWVIRFAELNHASNTGDRPNNYDANSTPDLSQPAATRKVDPAYPLQLMRENVSGTVILYALIRADGTVGNVRILRGVDDRLDRFASQAVAQWQFQPATRNGTPVDVEATFQIPFHPQRATNF
jgi:TonB family protein